VRQVGTRARRAWVAGSFLAAAAVHAAAPAGPHSWHVLHLVAQKLYYAPIVLAAGWLGSRATVAVTAAVSAVVVAHVTRDWAGLPMVQAEELAELASYWLVAALSAALFTRLSRAYAQVEAAHGETLQALAASLELRERYTAGHSRRVRDYTLLLADNLGISDESVRRSLGWGALLHDIGKIGIPDDVLLKPGPLEAGEREVMRRHPELGAALVGEIAFLGGARELILAHHERYDGGGYPRGLAGSAIPLGARLFAVADAFDALTTDRPYARARSWSEAAALIRADRGTAFDPDVVDVFMRVPYEQWRRLAAHTAVDLAQGPSLPPPMGLQAERREVAS